VQKIGAQYIVKRITDQIVAPPPAAEAPPQEAPATAPRAAEAPAHDLDGQVITDETGQAVGTAHRLPGVAVYVVTAPHANREAELRRCLGEPEPRVLLHTEDGRLTGVIYVPDPSGAPRRVEGTRPDDV
jgi:hypothetical protein